MASILYRYVPAHYFFAHFLTAQNEASPALSVGWIRHEWWICNGTELSGRHCYNTVSYILKLFMLLWWSSHYMHHVFIPGNMNVDSACWLPNDHVLWNSRLLLPSQPLLGADINGISKTAWWNSCHWACRPELYETRTSNLFIYLFCWLHQRPPIKGYMRSTNLLIVIFNRILKYRRTVVQHNVRWKVVPVLGS